MTAADVIFHFVFFVTVFAVPITLAWASATEDPNWKVVDVSELWKHNGRVDKFAVIILGSWWVHTCAMILWILTKQVNDGNVVQYMGWALPIIVKMFAPTSTTQEKPSGS